MLARRLMIFSVFVGLVALFNNCDNNFTVVQVRNGNKLGSTGDVCLDQLKTVYATTYHPFLRSTCGACHGDKHGSANVTTSFNSFMTYGAGLIDIQATTAHGGNALGPQYQPQIDAFKPEWNDANDDYLVCKAQQQNSESGGSSVIDLPLVSKVVPNLAATAANNNTYASLSYNVATEVASNNQMNVIRGVFRIDVKLWVSSGATIGLIFRNPQFSPAAGSPAFVLTGLTVALNGADQSQFFTTFKTLGTANLGIGIPAGPATGTLAFINLAGAQSTVGAPIAFAGVTAQTQVAVTLKNLIFNGVVAPPPGSTPTPPPTPTPAVVTFTQLTAAGGVFANSCVACHNANNQQANLDLTNYAEAFAARATIANRVVNTAAPMPPTGLLPAAQQATVTSWVNGGAPQ